MIESQGDAMGRTEGSRAVYSAIEGADMDEGMQKLQSDVEHIRIEISDVKTDIRQLRDQVDATKSEVGTLRVDVEKGFGTLRAEAAAFRTDMERALGSMRVMFLTGNMALAAAILTVLARVFKWI